MRIYRRHTAKCKRGFTSRDQDKCTCPFWIDLRGEGGQREPLGVRDMARATKLAAEKLKLLEPDAIAKPSRPRLALAAAVEKYHQAFPERAAETVRKYRRVLQVLQTFCMVRDISHVDEVTPTDLIDYRTEHNATGWTWLKEVEIIKAFFRFAVDAEWISKSPALILKRPAEPESEVVPYFPNEVAKMISACPEIGRSNYERRRALGMILVLRFTGMRISDVVSLSQDDIKGDYIDKRLVKNHKKVKIEINSVLRAALEALPEPKASVPGNRFLFWNGRQSLRSALKGADRTLQAVFRKAGVEGAHAHKFRHLLASELLAKGATIQDVASALGDSPRIVERHYSRWIPERQTRQDKLLREVHGTFLAHTESEDVM